MAKFTFISAIALFALSTAAQVANTGTIKLTKYTGDKPKLADRSPFGFGSEVTGGDGGESYVVTNMNELRFALENLTEPRTVYVKGTIDGAFTNTSKKVDCDWYIKNSVAQFNFTRYMMAWNETYMGNLTAALKSNSSSKTMAANLLIDPGHSVKEWHDLLQSHIGWRQNVSDKQRSVININARGHLTLIGLDGAQLNGVQTVFTNQTNVIIRNLKFTPPKDCVPEPESPGAWNARYDAVTLANSTNFWVDGNTFQDGPSVVMRDRLGLWDWDIDRYDGLFDARLGSDFITFSHNVVSNHHKSCLFGGSASNAPVDTGKMRFTIFGNNFNTSESRNPMMRHGTFYIVNNLYTQAASDGGPLYDVNDPGKVQPKPAEDDEYAHLYVPSFDYNMAVDNYANVLIAGNVFAHSANGSDADPTRLIRFSNVKNATNPAVVCVPSSANDKDELDNLAVPVDAINGVPIDMAANANGSFAYYTMRGTVKEGALKTSCKGFAGQDMPKSFKKAEEVEKYVRAQAGKRK